ncbi:hypothetical protein EII17_07025 [Clostridiales bacterium COT073_COT-073]|nr:hypothetical protein EII17_07025 [Clostridiales bacterium COT073_COT-073]
MRKILEFPKINENDIEKVSKVIDTIANNLDKDCKNELNELQSLTGKSYLPEEFAEYWGWTDLDNLARITLMPTPPCVSDLDRNELELIIEIIREAFISGEDDKGGYYIELLQKSVAIPEVINYIMSDQDVKTIANRILSDKNNVILL